MNGRCCGRCRGGDAKSITPRRATRPAPCLRRHSVARRMATAVCRTACFLHHSSMPAFAMHRDCGRRWPQPGSFSARSRAGRSPAELGPCPQECSERRPGPSRFGPPLADTRPKTRREWTRWFPLPLRDPWRPVRSEDRTRHWTTPVATSSHRRGCGMVHLNADCGIRDSKSSRRSESTGGQHRGWASRTCFLLWGTSGHCAGHYKCTSRK